MTMIHFENVPLKTHEEKIKCPECSSIQKAIVQHTFPWMSYVHECKNCNYIIMESEWEKVEETKPELKEGKSLLKRLFKL